MKKLVLDPGHGANDDRGFYGDGAERTEGVNNFLTCVEIKKYLEERYVVDIKMTRQTVNDNPWPGRGSMYPNVDLFYSRHSNAYNGTVRGSEVLVGTGSAAASKLAAELCAKMAELFGHNNRGLVNGDSFAVIREAKSSGAKMAMLAEFGFHDNKIDADFMINNRKLIAAWEGEIIAKHLALPAIQKIVVAPVATPVAKPVTTPTTGVDAPYGSIYAIRVSSMKKWAGAEAERAKAVAAGFPQAYIELVPFSKEK